MTFAWSSAVTSNGNIHLHSCCGESKSPPSSCRSPVFYHGNVSAGSIFPQESTSEALPLSGVNFIQRSLHHSGKNADSSFEPVVLVKNGVI